MKDKSKYSRPQDIKWPQDRYGITTDFKKALTLAASRVGGYTDKKAILDATMKIALAYIDAKFNREEADLKERIANASKALKNI